MIWKRSGRFLLSLGFIISVCSLNTPTWKIGANSSWTMTLVSLFLRHKIPPTIFWNSFFFESNILLTCAQCCTILCFLWDDCIQLPRLKGHYIHKILLNRILFFKQSNSDLGHLHKGNLKRFPQTCYSVHGVPWLILVPWLFH